MIQFHHIQSQAVNAENNSAVIDNAHHLAKLKNDAALGRLLEIAPSALSKIRHGKRPIGATIALRLHETTGISIAEIKTILIREVPR